MGSANNITPDHLNKKTGPEFLLTVVFIVCKTHVGSWVKKISRPKAICWMDSLFENNYIVLCFMSRVLNLCYASL